jgi:hypothetical protein
MKKNKSMQLISDEELLSLNQRGLIPGPYESVEEFSLRSRYCLNLQQTLQEQGISNQIERDSLAKETFSITEPLYGIKPDWVPLLFDNYKLLPWHGGSSWIFQMEDNFPTAALIQLRTQFKSQNRWLGYDRKELIAHEMAHVGRMMFHEKKFEEFFAWQSSPSSYRKLLGPLFESGKESTLFAYLLVFIILMEGFAIFLGNSTLISFFGLFFILPLVFLGFGLLRLTQKHRLFQKTHQKFMELTRSEVKTNAILYRLTDEEFFVFSQMDTTSILKYFQQHEDEDLRLKTIFLAYLRNAKS